jgi:hypothetical protein
MMRFILGTCLTSKSHGFVSEDMEARIASLLFCHHKLDQNDASNCETLHCCYEERQRFSLNRTGVRNECRR